MQFRSYYYIIIYQISQLIWARSYRSARPDKIFSSKFIKQSQKLTGCSNKLVSFFFFFIQIFKFLPTNFWILIGLTQLLIELWALKQVFFNYVFAILDMTHYTLLAFLVLWSGYIKWDVIN